LRDAELEYDMWTPTWYSAPGTPSLAMGLDGGASGLYSGSAIPDLGSMVSAIESIGSTGSGGMFGGGGGNGDGGGGAGGGF